ncbi:YcnI family protein [Candidatus Solirubrobacter pratensis]|uniref:YcnI family protein n=1 Tax=Candidatus Solirubrobacter pratensis TaxID=1298857 RepID=UPI0004195B7D|nr:YcnI family protein [Candidatus Solirubrobacter pratensis]
MRPRTLAAALATAALALPATAQAHVTLQPSSVPAGGDDTLLDVRVPNERSDASTVKVDLQLPPGFASASFQPVPGWSVKVTKVKLPKPIMTDDGEITEGVSRITWTGNGKQGSIPPGGFQDFGLSVVVPGKAGDELTFKALQTYSNGDVVRWIGAKDSDNPAPTVAVTAAGDSAKPAATPAAAATSTATKSDGSNGLAVAALIVGALGLIAGIAGLTATRRKTARA